MVGLSPECVPVLCIMYNRGNFIILSTSEEFSFKVIRGIVIMKIARYYLRSTPLTWTKHCLLILLQTPPRSLRGSMFVWNIIYVVVCYIISSCYWGLWINWQILQHHVLNNVIWIFYEVFGIWADPYHLDGSGSTSLNVDPDPGRKKSS